MKTMFFSLLALVRQEQFTLLLITSIFRTKRFERILWWLSVHSNTIVISFHGKRPALKYAYSSDPFLHQIPLFLLSKMVRIPTTQHGILDQADLRTKLEHYVKLNKRIICSLNAASNISGILTDVDAVSTLVHTYGGLIFWDYATAAPYVPIDMNPSPMGYKDAIFISTHKFIGGPGTSGEFSCTNRSSHPPTWCSSQGILIAKKDLFSLKAPRACGGGTVNFVTRTCREYNHDIEIREEGGTPDIIGCIRAGLVFQLKDSIDMDYMQARENELVKRFYRRFKKVDTLILLGSTTAVRLPIFSFIVYVPGVCKYLHHNFICLLLNDLFGIQVRSGCACAGPYALDLLNVDDAKTDIYCMFMTEDAWYAKRIPFWNTRTMWILFFLVHE